jgi:hypothetical protein
MDYWSARVYEIPNSKHQITNKSQIFTLWNPPEEGRQEAAFHRAGIQWPKQVWNFGRFSFYVSFSWQPVEAQRKSRLKRSVSGDTCLPRRLVPSKSRFSVTKSEAQQSVGGTPDTWIVLGSDQAKQLKINKKIENITLRGNPWATANSIQATVFSQIACIVLRLLIFYVH